VLLHNIVTKNILKDNEKKEEVNKRASKNSGPEIENKNNSFEGTQAAKNKTVIGRKRKQVYHLEGEFKNIKASTFDEESRMGEEVEAWLLDIKKYFHIYNYSSSMKF